MMTATQVEAEHFHVLLIINCNDISVESLFNIQGTLPNSLK